MKKLAVYFAFAAVLMVGFGCKDGDAENAGEKLDEAAESAKEKTEEGIEKLGDAAADVGDKIKDATN